MANVIWNPGINSTNPTVELIVNQQSQSIDGNYSVLAYSLILHRPLSISSSTSKSYNVKINNVTVASGTTTIGGSGDKTIASGTATVYHNADGTKTGVPFSFYMDIGITWSGSPTGNASNSGTMNLTTIPRASSVSSIAGGALGSQVTVNIARASSSFTHTVIYKRTDGVEVTVGTGQGTSCVFTPDIADSQYLPNSTSGTATIIVKTYNGNTLIGTTSKTFTVTVPTSVVPTVSISKSGVDLYSSKYVQGRSKVAVTLSASEAYGSSIKTRSTTVKSGNNTITSSSSNSFTSGVINYSGTITIATTVTDSRGRTASASTTISVVAYSSPKITAFSAFRANSDGSANPQGAYIRITGSSSISSIDSTNTRSTILRYRLKGAGTWTNATTNTASYTPSLAATISADVNSSFEAQIHVGDYFSSTSQTVNVGTAFVLMDFHSSGNSMAIGKVAEGNGVLEINGTVNHTGNYKLNGGWVQHSAGEIYNILTTGKFVNDINATAGSLNAWNAGGNVSLNLVNANNRLAFLVGGVTNDRKAIIQVGHNMNAYADALGELRLNPFGGAVSINGTPIYFGVQESGSNTNGRYVKFGDGTMICSGSLDIWVGTTTSWGGMYISGQLTVTFPAGFAYAPSFYANWANSASDSNTMMTDIIYSGSARFRIARGATMASNSGALRWMAIGRWKA